MYLFINGITFFRLFAGILIFCLVYFNNYLASLLIFTIASASDFLDGYLARKYKLESSLGEIIDPVADKVLIIFLFMSITVAYNSAFIGFVSALIISREVIVAALRDYNSRNGNSSSTRVTFLAKAKTSVQLLAITIYLVALLLNLPLLKVIGDISLIISLIITLYTGIDYFVKSIKNE